MNPERDEASPAARALDGYLESLRTDRPTPAPNLVPSVVRKARWQRAVRAPLHAVGALVSALADGLAIMLGSGQSRRP